MTPYLPTNWLYMKRYVFGLPVSRYFPLKDYFNVKKQHNKTHSLSTCPKSTNLKTLLQHFFSPIQYLFTFSNAPATMLDEEVLRSQPLIKTNLIWTELSITAQLHSVQISQHCSVLRHPSMCLVIYFNGIVLLFTAVCCVYVVCFSAFLFIFQSFLLKSKRF